jgi:hypothetical protein
MLLPHQALFTDEQWDALGQREGISGQTLKAQVILSNELLEEILEEERAEKEKNT